MVQTKRQVTIERDRFGGYGDIGVKKENNYIDMTPSDISSVRNLGAIGGITVSDPEPSLREMPPITSARPEIEQKPIYSTRETVADVPSVTHRVHKEKKTLEHEDIMPSIKTRSYIEDAPVEDEPQPARERRARLNLDMRTKTLVIVYAVVALVLAIAVIATGVSISRATASAEQIGLEIANKQAIIDMQNQTIAELTNEATIRDEAVKNGMVYSNGSAFTASEVQKTEYPQAEPHTNPFDKFCDWLGKIIN